MTIANVSTYRAPDQIAWIGRDLPEGVPRARTTISRQQGERTITEKFPAMKYKMMISPQGNLVACPLADGAGTLRPTEDQVRKRLLALGRKGFVAAYECPHAMGRRDAVGYFGRHPKHGSFRKSAIDAKLKEDPCVAYYDETGAPCARGGQMCPHVRAEMRARQTEQKRKTREHVQGFKTDAVKMMDFIMAKEAKAAGLKPDEEPE